MSKRITVNPNTGEKTIEEDGTAPDRAATVAAMVAFVFFIAVIISLGIWAVVEIWQQILSAL